MRHAMLASLTLLAVVPALWGLDDAKDKPKPDTAQTPSQQFDTLRQAYSKLFDEYQKALQDAKTPAERRERAQENSKNPQYAKYLREMVELAEKNPTDLVAVQALTWTVGHPLQAGALADQAYGLLIAQADKQVSMACTHAGQSPSAAAEKFLRAVLDKNADAKLRSLAAMNLAQNLLTRAERGMRANPEEQKKMGQEALELVKQSIDDHADRPILRAMAANLGRSRLAAAPELLRLISEKAQNKDVKGQALYSLAENLRGQSERSSDPALSEKLGKEAEALYERVVKDFGDVQLFRRPLADTAAAALRELRLLGIGKVAPDIAAEDTDGKQFKLTDYRGKVVLLDFWGNW